MGSGGGGYFPTPKPDLERLIQQAKGEADRKRLDSDVNELLREILASYGRDPDKVHSHLEEIAGILKDEVEMEQFLFGGSVSKHTYVDGLSDIDALVILNREDLGNKSPQAVLDTFDDLLQSKLLDDTMRSIEKGKLAVTITYKDGLQIQLLPAIRIGNRVNIPDAASRGWNEINPKLFQEALSKANTRLNGSLVPVIKLAKSINSGLPTNSQLESYHIESLALESVKGYRGPSTPKALLMNFFDQAAIHVLHPIGDVTGQSMVVDSYLGGANSPKRLSAADALANISRKLNSATSSDQWKSILGE
jgi:hypothetical protein